MSALTIIIRKRQTAFMNIFFIKRRLITVCLLLVSLFAIGQNKNYTEKLPLVDKYFDSLLKEWNIPGLAIGIVYKDQLIYSKGFGYRDLEKKLPVEPTTLFPIA